MNINKVSELLVEIIETADEKSLMNYSEFIIKNCNNPECSVCKELKEALNEKN